MRMSSLMVKVCVELLLFWEPFFESFSDNKLGNWKADIKIPLESLEKLEGALEGESQQLFLRFLRKMLRWKSEERASARELLDDPWLRSA